MHQALKTLCLLVWAGHDFASALKKVADHFKVNEDQLAFEFDAANDDQWRD
jgi:hypothetical protein